MRKPEDDQNDDDNISEESDDESPPMVEKRVRIIDPKGESSATDAKTGPAPSSDPQPSTSTAQSIAEVKETPQKIAEKAPPPRRESSPSSLSLWLQKVEEDESSEAEEESEESLPRPYVEKKVRIIDPKEEKEKLRNEENKALEDQAQKDQEKEIKKQESITPGVTQDLSKAEDVPQKVSEEPLARQEAVPSSLSPWLLNEEKKVSDDEFIEESEESLPYEYVEKRVQIIDPKEEEEKQRIEKMAAVVDEEEGSDDSLPYVYVDQKLQRRDTVEEKELQKPVEKSDVEEQDSVEEEKISNEEIFDQGNYKMLEPQRPILDFTKDEFRNASEKEDEEEFSGDVLTIDDGKVEKQRVTRVQIITEKDDDKLYESVSGGASSIPTVDSDLPSSKLKASSSISEGAKLQDMEKRVLFLESSTVYAPGQTRGERIYFNDAEEAMSMNQMSEYSVASDKDKRRISDDVQTKSEPASNKDFLKSESIAGKQTLYSKYMDQSASVMKSSRQSFLYDFSQTEVSMTSSTDALHDDAQHSDDFTHGYRENKRFIIPPMTEHEIRRLAGHRFLEDVGKSTAEVSCGDHIALTLSYMTVNGKRDLKEFFLHVSNNMQSIGKVYSARMLSRYHEYARMFKYSGGNEGIVASMRFTSHCSDIIKSYIQLAALVEAPEEFTEVIMDLAKRHAKLGLNLRDHELHFRPFIEILGSSSDDRMQIYSKTFFFVSLVSRAMLLAEQKLRKSDPNQDMLSPMRGRSVTKSTRPRPELSKKQPIWD